MADFQTMYYEDGSAVRKYEPQALPTRETYRREVEQQRKAHIRERKRVHKHTLRLNRLYTVYFAFGLAVIGGFFAVYVHLQNSITNSMNNISHLEKEITTLKEENSAAKSRISTMTNLSHIKQVAMNELGMVYATNDQVVYYEVEDEDFMNAY